MSEFQNCLPGGPEVVPDSERDRMIEADEQALAKIRSMCAVGMVGAEAVAQPIWTDLTKLQRLRFASARRLSLELARTISDAARRDAALQYIIELCMTANDLEAAGILVRGIQSAPMRDELVLRYPALLP